MKLDEAVMFEIMDALWRNEFTNHSDATKFLKDLDLVFKPGDSSQSVLVTSEKKHIVEPAIAREIQDSCGVTDEDRKIAKEILEGLEK